MSQRAVDQKERLRRWKLALGEEDGQDLSPEDQRLLAALSALYNAPTQSKGRGGLGASAPRVSRWLGDIRDFSHAGRAGDSERRHIEFPDMVERRKEQLLEGKGTPPMRE